MPIDLDAIEARAAAATAGPWLSNSYYRCVQTGSGPLAAVCRYGDVGDRPPLDDYFELVDRDPTHPEIANPAFIAHARADIPAMAAEIRALREALADLREWTHDEHCSHDTGDYSGCDLTPVVDALLDGGS